MLGILGIRYIRVEEEGYALDHPVREGEKDRFTLDITFREGCALDQTVTEGEKDIYAMDQNVTEGEKEI